ncbi:hypothetical protein [Staphylococcus americanisciuri]|uniref:Uncharacterized protein n=1 Tax=Staphylococcus americanisciuri TaxID=2973940 RepID=A0ABT2EYZ6_9STAP|nr:hypothetical protein [Staphylococcus americanisciuri]MCS4485291.1 hypothetical protein [Staphylococcus americanisciuri]
MDYEHLNLVHFFARNEALDDIRQKSDFMMINNIQKVMMYRTGEVEGTVDLIPYFYNNRSQAMSFVMMKYRRS